MDERPELELIARSERGDQEALAELFRRHYKASLRLARGIMRSEDDAQDAVQTAYVSAFQHFRSFRAESSFKTWISRIVINCCVMQMRSPWRRAGRVPLDELPGGRGADLLVCPAPTPERSAYSREIHSAVGRALSLLPRHLRDPFTLCCVSGLSIKEVAAVLGLTQAATKTRVFRARARVRVHLQPVWARRRVA